MKTEKLTAVFEVDYKDQDDQVKTTNFSREFEVSYPIVIKGIQPLAGIIAFLGIIGGSMYYFVFRRKDRYFVGFLRKYLNGEWKSIYSDSVGALSAYKNQEKPSALKGLEKDITSILERYKTDESLREYMDSLSHNVATETEENGYHAWLIQLRKEIGKKRK